MRKYSLRSKLVATACAASLAIAMPAMAFAAPSPSNTSTATGQNNVVINVGGTTVSGSAVSADWFKVVPTDQVAQGTPSAVNPAVDASTLAAGGQIVIASFEVTTSYDINELGAVTLTFNVGTQYAGATAYVYVQHEDGAVETQTATVSSDGTVTVTVDRLSIFTIAIDANTIPADAGVKADKGATSPQTGVSVLAVALGTGAMAAAAGGTGVALRKKVRG